MPQSPTSDNSLVAFRILTNGTAIKAAYQVQSVEVSQRVNCVGSAHLQLLDGDLATGTFPTSDAADFLPGAEVAIYAGYLGANDDLIFKGLVVKHGLESSSNGALLVLECYESAVKMTAGPKSAVFTDCTDSAAIARVISGHGISAAVDATAVVHPALVQSYATDWDFVTARATANGLVVLSESGRLTVTAPNTSTAPALTLTYGENILHFSLSLDARSQYPTVQAQAWDAAQQAVITAEAPPPAVALPGNVPLAALAQVLAAPFYALPLAAGSAEPVLQTQADAWQVQAALAKVRGTVLFPGNAQARLGGLVMLAGLSQRFNGPAYVAGVTHTLAEGNWTTKITLGLDAPAPATALPGLQGLYNGVVTQMHDDPAGEFRVAVAVPALQSQTLWARLSQPAASNGSGAYCYPAVGDEVVLGFFNHDPQQPVVLGGLYSSRRPPAFSPTAANQQAGWVTPEKLTIAFDDENRTIVLSTPAGHRVELNDDTQTLTLRDANQNSVVLSPDGILLDSTSSLHLMARQDILLQAGGRLALTAATDLQLKALEIDVSAQTQLKLAGTAAAELSAAGQVTIKAAMVMIN